jgi:hypothetical protein
LRFRAAHARHRLRQCPESSERDRFAAQVAHPVSAVVELGDGALCTRQYSLQRIPHADISQPAHCLGGAITHPLSEPDSATPLRTAGERRQALTGGVTASLEISSDRLQVQVVAMSRPVHCVPTIARGGYAGERLHDVR